MLLGGTAVNAQVPAAVPSAYTASKKYTIDSIKVTGLKSFSAKTVVSYSGLRKGQSIQVPGEKISSVIQKLWNLDLFSDINFYIAEINGNLITLEIEIEELPTLSDVKIVGVKKNKAESLIKDTELTKGKKLSESFLTNTKNYIVNKYKKEGYLNTKVVLNTIPDSTEQNVLKMVVNIDRGNRVKIKSIDFEGIEKFSANKLAAQFKNTKKKNIFRFWKKSKYISKDYQEDLTSLIDFYKEKGYRDARVISDTIIDADNTDLAIKLKIEEGNKYYFGDIKYLGNAAYTNRVLASVLGIKKGDTYNGVLLKKRIADDTKPDSNDITNLYQNSGYLFSNINAVEVSAENDTINFEIRVTEGKLASFNKITVIGNDKTNDHVIFRELRTKPLHDRSNECFLRDPNQGL